MSSCADPCCFFCTMNEPNTHLRRSKLARCFNQMPQNDNENTLILTLSTLWRIAMKQPNDPEFPSLGIFHCMSMLIQRALNDTVWLLRGQNIYVPYYAAHIIGSYAAARPELAEAAVEASVVAPLVELLRGRLTWLEKGVAARALSHLARNATTFAAVAARGRELVALAMDTAARFAGEVYDEFVSVKESARVKYHCDLLTRGLGGVEAENAKAEDWACQTRCWSLSLLACFASREACLGLICEREFLNGLCVIWGGLGHRDWPCGVGLVRALCDTKTGRQSLSGLTQVVEFLCRVARSSDDWQIMAIESLLLLLKDPETRLRVMDMAVLGLGGLVELGRDGLGQAITRVLLQDYHKVKYGDLRLSERTETALEEIWDLKVDRKKRERLMSEDEIARKTSLVGQFKKQGNLHFRLGNVEKAIAKYSEGLRLCHLKRKKDRVVLYSNRAQCQLVLGEPDRAISDATRALCLSSRARPHDKSLWRRAQAYDMKGFARESLMDCLAFVTGRLGSGNWANRGGIIPYYAVRMIAKQVNTTWIFAHLAGPGRSRGEKSDGCGKGENLIAKTESTSTRRESIEGLSGKRWRRKKIEMVALRCKKEHHRHCQIHVKES